MLRRLSEDSWDEPPLLVETVRREEPLHNHAGAESRRSASADERTLGALVKDPSVSTRAAVSPLRVRLPSSPAWA